MTQTLQEPAPHNGNLQLSRRLSMVEVCLVLAGTFAGAWPTTAAQDGARRVGTVGSPEDLWHLPRSPLTGTEPAPVKFTVSVTENAERIRGTFSGVLSDVDDRLNPNGAVATIMNGEFDVAFLQPPN